MLDCLEIHKTRTTPLQNKFSIKLTGKVNTHIIKVYMRYRLAKTHKFQNKIEITYEELMKANFENVIRLVRMMEKEIGVEKAHELLLRARVEGDLEGVKTQMKGLNLSASSQSSSSS